MHEGQTMPNLSSQIETLYRVIGQIRPESGTGTEPARQEPSPSRPAAEACAQIDASLRPANRAASVRWIFTFYCFWFSLPLSVWFSSGWIGLFFYWRALAGTARLVELADALARRPVTRRKRFVPVRHRGFTSSPFQLRSFPSGLLEPVPVLSVKGGARCSAIERKIR